MATDKVQETVNQAANDANDRYVVTLDDFSDPEGPIEGINSVDCHDLFKLYDLSLEGLDEGHAKKKSAYRLLSQICMLHFKPRDRSGPYGAMYQFEDGRSAIVSDFRGDQSAILAQLAPTIKSPALRGRLADVAWLNNKKLSDSARMAIAAYIECVRLLIDGLATTRSGHKEPWSVASIDIIFRAASIAYQLGREKPEALLVQKIIREVYDLAKDRADDRGFLRTAQLAIHFGVSDNAIIAEDIERVAKRLLSQSDFLNAHEYFEAAAAGFRSAKKQEDVERCTLSSAECLVKTSDIATEAMSRAHWLQQAIATLRTCKGTQIRRRELQVLLLEAQGGIVDEMSSFSFEVDLSDFIDQSKGLVKNKTLIRALFEFAFISNIPSVQKLREDAIKASASSPLSSMFSESFHDAEGKTVAMSPGLDFRDPSEDGIRHAILRDEGHRHTVTASGGIEPARLTIFLQHPVDENSFELIVHESPFIPPYREAIFASGFARMFAGDYLTAAHLLFPQVENCLRFVLKQSGTDVSSIKSDMTQEDMTLSRLLSDFRPQLEAIFGPDIIYDIENVFDIKGGPALRHSLAHGLMNEGEFWSGNTMYGCWLIFSLTMRPLVPYMAALETRYGDL